MALHIQKSVCPCIEQPAFGGIPYVGQPRTVAYTDGGRYDGDRTVRSARGQASVGRGITGGREPARVVGKNFFVQLETGNVGAQNIRIFNRSHSFVIVGKVIRMDRLQYQRQEE